MEMKNENENESHGKLVQQIQHLFHEQHPLVLVAEQSNEGLKAHCHGCGELLSASCFTCIHCNYHLHKQCADAPLEIPNHPLHPQHPTFESPMAIDMLYFFGFDCPSFIIHKKCLDELPTKINHPSHHIHPLFLNYSYRNHFCNLCQEEHSGPFYRCSFCHFNINLECALLRSIIEDKRRNQHPFSLLWKQGSFICDAYNTEGNYISYICLKCYIVVHKKCISLPRIIKFSRHAHCIFHKYFLQTQELTKQDCKICFKEVRLERGSYSCVKQGCNYIVHVNCVLEYDVMYEVIEDEKQWEELYKKSMQSSIISVIEVNEAGEATKIEHFSHQHCLVLADKMEKEIDRKCDGIGIEDAVPLIK
nr:unnamed protein product [Gossypium raimondii]